MVIMITGEENDKATEEAATERGLASSIKAKPRLTSLNMRCSAIEMNAAAAADDFAYCSVRSDAVDIQTQKLLSMQVWATCISEALVKIMSHNKPRPTGTRHRQHRQTRQNYRYPQGCSE